MTVRDELAVINQEFAQAMVDRDADRLAGYYTDDAVFIEADSPTLSGRAAIANKFRGPDTGAFPITFESGEVIEDRDLVVDIGSIMLEGNQLARYVVVYRRQSDGSLKMAVDVPISG